MFSYDGASVMLGCENGVQAKLISVVTFGIILLCGRYRNLIS